MAQVSKSNCSAPKNPRDESESREHSEAIWRTEMHRIVNTFVGQAIMMQLDKLLWTLEKTATWIHNGKTDSKQPADLVRPLPWVFFLPTLVLLRYTRVILSLLSICLGYDEIEATTMVAWLHRSRRTVRHIVHEAKRKKQLRVAHSRSASIAYFKRAILLLLSNLSRVVFSAPCPIAVCNNKTSLNSPPVDESTQPDRPSQNDGVSSNSNSEHSDDEYEGISDSSDADDEDFVHNGDILSDADSQSSTTTEDTSNDDEIDMNRSPVDAGTAMAREAIKFHDDSGDSDEADTSIASMDRSERAVLSEASNHQNDTETATTSLNVQADDALNQLMDDIKACRRFANEIDTQNRGGKNIKRHTKSGRSQAKPPNNSKHFNGRNSASNLHAIAFHDFTVSEAASDRTQTD